MLSLCPNQNGDIPRTVLGTFGRLSHVGAIGYSRVGPRTGRDLRCN